MTELYMFLAMGIVILIVLGAYWYSNEKFNLVQKAFLDIEERLGKLESK